MMPIITRYLTPEQYGVFSVYLIYTSIIATFIGLSSTTSFIKIYHNKTYDNKSYLITCFYISLATCILMFALILILDEVIYKNFVIKKAWLYIGVLFVFFESIISIQLSLYRLEEKVRSFGAFVVSSIAVRSMMTLYFVMVLNYEEFSLILSSVLVSFLYFHMYLYLY